jgi:hypothetical protein
LATEVSRPEVDEYQGVKFLGNCRLIDVLSEWGSHNTQWRLGREVVDVLDAVEIALTYYAPLVSRIISAIPLNCLRVEFTAEDLPLINIADGRLMTDWTTPSSKMPHTPASMPARWPPGSIPS